MVGRKIIPVILFFCLQSSSIFALDAALTAKLDKIHLSAEEVSGLLVVPDKETYWYFSPIKSQDRQKAAIVSLYKEKSISLYEATDALMELVSTELHEASFTSQVDDAIVKISSDSSVDKDKRDILINRLIFLKNKPSVVNQIIADLYLGRETDIDAMMKDDHAGSDEIFTLSADNVSNVLKGDAKNADFKKGSVGKVNRVQYAAQRSNSTNALRQNISSASRPVITKQSPKSADEKNNEVSSKIASAKNNNVASPAERRKDAKAYVPISYDKIH